MPPTVPVNYYSDPEGQQNRINHQAYILYVSLFIISEWRGLSWENQVSPTPHPLGVQLIEEKKPYWEEEEGSMCKKTLILWTLFFSWKDWDPIIVWHFYKIWNYVLGKHLFWSKGASEWVVSSFHLYCFSHPQSHFLIKANKNLFLQKYITRRQKIYVT